MGRVEGTDILLTGLTWPAGQDALLGQGKLIPITSVILMTHHYSIFVIMA
jgi:hypothetical protein